MKKSYKIFLTIVIILIITLSGLGIYFWLIRKNEPENPEPPVNETIVTNTIEEYGYNLEDRDTELFKTKFEELKELLNTEEYDKESYIKFISELFIIDLYTIDNKISRYDVGGLEYVYKDAQESFRSVAENSIYKTVENNVDDTRTQALPIVSSVNISELGEYTYKMPDDSEVMGYRVVVDWTYEQDLGYDKSATLVLIPDEQKLGIVFFKPRS